MHTPDYEDQNNTWNINMLLDREAEDKENTRERTPDLEDDIFAQKYTHFDVEIF